MKTIKESDLPAIALGAGILGSGGGGDASYDLLYARKSIQQYGPVPLLSLEELKNDDVVMPIAYMGAPLVGQEKLPSGKEFEAIYRLACQILDKPPTLLMPAEIGGSNALAPLAVAGKLGLPVLDADTIGRAFPELQMSSCHLFEVSASPAILSDNLQQTAVLFTQNGQTLEHFARHLCMAMGSNAAVAIYFMQAMQAKKSVVAGSLSRAWEIGNALLNAREDPIECLIKTQSGRLIGKGIVNEIQQEVQGGFLQGSVTLSSETSNWKVVYQNEYLIAYENGHLAAATPDILCIVHAETGHPIASESLQFGQEVALIELPAPPLWKTAKGLQLVGPKAFGFTSPTPEKEIAHVL